MAFCGFAQFLPFSCFSSFFHFFRFSTLFHTFREAASVRGQKVTKCRLRYASRNPAVVILAHGSPPASLTAVSAPGVLRPWCLPITHYGTAVNIHPWSISSWTRLFTNIKFTHIKFTHITDTGTRQNSQDLVDFY